MQKFLIGLVIFLAVIAVIGLVLPTEYEIEKSIEIDATPEAIHAFVGDLEQWESWAPWYEADPTIKVTMGEKTTGVGASQSWTAEDGDGELTFTESDAKTGIGYDMAFIMGETRAPSVSAMKYKTANGKTTVTWTMNGDADAFAPPVIGGYMTALMKGQIGGMFDQGLENLKTKVEAAK